MKRDSACVWERRGGGRCCLPQGLFLWLTLSKQATSKTKTHWEPWFPQGIHQVHSNMGSMQIWAHFHPQNLLDNYPLFKRTVRSKVREQWIKSQLRWIIGPKGRLVPQLTTLGCVLFIRSSTFNCCVICQMGFFELDRNWKDQGWLSLLLSLPGLIHL